MTAGPAGPIRVAIVDDHHFMRLGIEHHFATVPDIDVTASAPDPERLPPPAAGRGPDVILMDLRMPGGRTTLPAVEAWSPHVAVLMMSVSGEERDVLAALRRGAKGYLTKQAEPEDFLEAVRTVAHGGFYLSRDLAAVIRRIPDDDTASRPEAALTDREEEVLAGIAAGLTHRQVARRLAIKESTVDTHVKRIRLKRKLGNKADLVRLAMELGLIEG